MDMDNRLPTWAVATLAVLAGIVTGLWISLVDLRDDHDDTRRLLAEWIEHEVDQAQMLCDKGVSEAEGCEDGE